MALSKQVEDSLKDAESSLRNALAFSARNEKPFINTVIANMIRDIDQLIQVDKFMDKIEERGGFSFDKE
ncbi:hypothetical protein EB001_05105 [bacterium]|nr:hypothetical protein [bacterium]